MARSKPTAETTEKVMAAVLEEGSLIWNPNVGAKFAPNGKLISPLR